MSKEVKDSKLGKKSWLSIAFVVVGGLYAVATGDIAGGIAIASGQ